MRLREKTAIVTGAASGFGLAIANRFVAEGARVVYSDINGDGAAAAAREAGDSALAVSCDVSDPQQVKDCVGKAVSAFGSVDILVNNAGWSYSNQPLAETTLEQYEKVFDINVKSIFLMCQATLPHMRAEGGGSIINVGSTGGIRPRPGLVWYNASKGAVNHVSKCLAVELAAEQIRVNCLAPVMGVTGLLETFMGTTDTPENREKFLATIPMGRLCEPEDMAKAALFLASDESLFITGTVMEVDGGRCI